MEKWWNTLSLTLSFSPSPPTNIVMPKWLPLHLGRGSYVSLFWVSLHSTEGSAQTCANKDLHCGIGSGKGAKICWLPLPSNPPVPRTWSDLTCRFPTLLMPPFTLPYHSCSWKGLSFSLVLKMRFCSSKRSSSEEWIWLDENLNFHLVL